MNAEQKKTLGRVTLIALVIAAVVGYAFGSLARELPPEGGQPKPFNLPERETISLDNGLMISFVEFGVVPKVAVSVVVRTGNLDEGADTWLADITGELMREGAAGRSAQEIANDAASMGGDVSIRVGANTTTVSLDVLSEFGPEAVRLLADIVTRPTLPESELGRIKADFERRLSVAKSQPQSLATEAYLELIYGDHAYGRVFPTAEQLAGYDIGAVRAYYNGNFGAQRTHVYIAGRFDRAVIRDAMSQAFAGWKRGPETLVDIPKADAAKRVKLVSRPDAPQSTIYLGLPVPDVSDRDHIPLSVANTLLGGYFSSRITSNIREDKGYTYSPRSSIASQYRVADWHQQADVTTAVTGPALKEIYAEIDRLQLEAPKEPELAAVKNYVGGVFVLRNATRTGLISQLATVDFHGLGDTYLKDYVDKIFAVTPEKVSEMAIRYLRDEDMALVVVGDLDQVRPQLADLPQLDGVAIE